MPRYLRQVARVSMLASLSLWLLELAYILSTGSWPVWSPKPACAFLLLTFLLFSGWGVAGTLVQWACIAVLAPIRRSAALRWGETRARVVTAGSGTLLLSVPLAHFTLQLFSGKGISRFAYVSTLKTGFFALALIAVFASLSAIAAAAGGWFSPARRSLRSFTARGGTVLAVFLYVLNARLYVGQYEFVHQACGLFLFLIAELVLLTLLGPRRPGAPPAGRVTRLLWALAFLAPCELLLLSRGIGGTPGSSQLSYLHSRTSLGKHLVRIYGFREEVGTADTRYYEEYRAAQDAFVTSAPKIRKKGCNVVWIVVDSLRASNLPMYGYERDTSPRLEEFARRSTLFLRAYAQGPTTDTSFPPMLTGCYLSTLQRRGGLRGVDTIAEIFVRHGYRAWAIIQEWDLKTIKEQWNTAKMLRGEAWTGSIFEKVFASPPERMYAAPEINRRAVELLRGGKRNAPFFLLLFYYEPHLPFEKHAGFDFGTREEDLYDSEIAYTDRHIGALLDEIRRAGIEDDTIVVVTADHGEEIGMYGGWGHGLKLYDALIRVPLIIHVPGVAPGVVDTPVQLIDICPTLAQMLGLSAGTRFDGSSLVPLMEGLKPPYTPLVFSAAESGNSRTVCLVYYPWKLVYHISEAFFSLFNLADDPRERVNRIGADAGIAELLRHRLLSWMSYRDGSATGQQKAGAPAVGAILQRLRACDPAARGELRSLKAADLSPSDFSLLSRELVSHFSREAAEFYLSIARLSPDLRSAAIRDLRVLAESASTINGGAGTDPRREEAEAILSVLATSGTPEFLASIVRRGGDSSEADALALIGLGGMTSLRDELFDLYTRRARHTRLKKLLLPPYRLWRWFFPRKTPRSEDLIFPALCRLADPRVEKKLLTQAEESCPEDRFQMVPLFVNYRSEACRGFLLRLLDNNVWHWHEPPASVAVSAEIGKSRNPFMLPVLMKIIMFPIEKDPHAVPLALPFSRKEAILHFIRIKGEQNLTRGERQAIQAVCRDDPCLAQFEEIRRLRRSL